MQVQYEESQLDNTNIENNNIVININNLSNETNEQLINQKEYKKINLDIESHTRIVEQDKTEVVDECCICLDNLHENLFTLKCCNNTIHNYCMINWLLPSKSDICFLCKQKIPNLNSLLDKEYKLNPFEIIIINHIVNPHIAINIPNSTNNSNITNSNITNSNESEVIEKQLKIFSRTLIVLLVIAILITFIFKVS